MSDDYDGDYGEASERAADEAREVQKERDDLRAALKVVLAQAFDMCEGNASRDMVAAQDLLDRTGPRCEVKSTVGDDGCWACCNLSSDHTGDHEGRKQNHQRAISTWDGKPVMMRWSR